MSGRTQTFPPEQPGAKSSGRLVDGEFAFTAEDFQRIAAILHADSGIALPETKATLVYSRLAKRLRTLGLESFKAYCALIVTQDGADERMKMLAALTTNVTRFFREPHHFDHLRTTVLPPLLEKAKRGGRVRIWSAACSNGQEPYSIALTILGLAPNAADLDVRVLATDIDPNMVAEGRAGVYGETAMAAVPAALRERWFVPVNEGAAKGWGVVDQLRELVAFRELNLIGEWPMKGKFQAIFCRNVVIYFQDDTQAKIWSRFAPLLDSDGRLYIGHSERVSGPATALFQTDGITTYRLQKGARP